MRTTLEVDRDLLDEAARLAGEKSLSLTVNKALGEFVRRRRLEQLRKHLGTKRLIDNWREQEELELGEMREQFG
jgi:hypothetical protein